MKAVVWTRYGPPDVLELRDIEKPTPGDDQIAIRIHATTVFPGDCEIRAFKFPSLFWWVAVRLFVGITRPRGTRVLGQEMAGVVDAVGKDVTQFKVGDPVFGATEMNFGAYAEYICLKAKGALVTKPAGLTFEEAAAIPVGALNALHFLRKADIRRGETILINGAGGCIGTAAIQLAKYYGADVTCVDRTDKLDKLLAVGADKVIDYTQQDFTRNGETYDVIFDVVGKSPYARSLGSLNKSGRYLLANTSMTKMFRGVWTSITGSKKVISALAPLKVEDLVFLTRLIEAGRLKPVIDRRFSLEQIVEAHRYVESGRKTGHVVITVV